ncbi:unannotated protein [freshwater metagenome]|uniref:Unannotated protein n=1 Tax=freshwater metagenome TaxID=449393 RepID=A0A6J7CVD6_9ZZZZ|nr:M20/M25/M40 family metallo-hydrolase [Actinomycetota bacterium]
MATPWIADHAAPLAASAERDLEALAAISTPSGDVAAAEEVVAVASALAPPQAAIERLPCSSQEHAPDLLLRVAGPGTRRILLVGHLDTVVPHEGFITPRRLGTRLRGSGTYDMKAGVALALGLLRALVGREELAEVALLLVNDEEWRIGPFGHVDRFAGFDACLCFEAGELDPQGHEAVVVRRKSAMSVVVRAHGRAAHSGSAPDAGVNALLALAQVAQHVAARHDPHGADRVTAVPTIFRSGEALNVVPAAGELTCDLRGDRLEALRAVAASIPEQAGGARIETRIGREWPGMDALEATTAVLEAAATAAGMPIVGAARGGASDASHFAATIPVTIDGLGARGGHAHHPDEFVDLDSLAPRAQVALAIAEAVLRGTGL